MTADLVFQAGVAMRSVPRVVGAALRWVGSLTGRWITGWVRDWTTGRRWLLRLGYAALTEPKPLAEDWVWMIDHTVQIGRRKCLVVLGLRLSEVDWPGRALRHADVQVLALVPMTQSNGPLVAAELEAVQRRLGPPRAIVSDQGADLTAGIALFRQAHPEVIALEDIAHRGARFLQHRFEADPRWATFVKETGQAKQKVRQTELSYLMGPVLRSKTRYMNVGAVLRWGRRTLEILEKTGAENPRLEEKYGWLRQYADAMQQWQGWYETVHVAVRWVRRQGYYRVLDGGVAEDLKGRWPAELKDTPLAAELETFVAEQSQQGKLGEHLPGSTEVLESCLGRWKALERQQANLPFSASVLLLPAMLYRWTQDRILEALNRVPMRVVDDWCRTHLDPNPSTLRRLAHTPNECKQTEPQPI